MALSRFRRRERRSPRRSSNSRGCLTPFNLHSFVPSSRYLLHRYLPNTSLTFVFTATAQGLVFQCHNCCHRIVLLSVVLCVCVVWRCVACWFRVEQGCRCGEVLIFGFLR